MRPLEPLTLSAVIDFKIILLLGKGSIDALNKAQATRRHPAHRDHGVALGVVIRDREDFAVGTHAVNDALDDLIGGLIGAGV